MLTRVLVPFFLASGVFHTFAYTQEPVGSQEPVSPGTPAPIVLAVEAIKDPSSYALGLNIGANVAKGRISSQDIEIKDFMLGFIDALEKREPKLSEKQFQAAMTSFQMRMQKKILEIAKRNLEKSNVYLEENKKKDGIQVTKTGLQYQVLKSGSGKSPSITDSVLAHYEGKLIDGFLFDSSIKRNKPETIDVKGDLPGLSEAFQRMKVGDKWVVTLPPNLAYGEGGADPDIGPNEVLIFEIELLDVIKK
jgi:FKBP-type peptidyl-prolyl cis-trans isomerase